MDYKDSAAKLYNNKIENKANGKNRNTESSNKINNYKDKNGIKHKSLKNNINGSVNIADTLNNHWMKEFR